MAFKHVIVKLHNLLNENTGDDPGDALEVYGRFDVTRFVFNPDIGEVVTLGSATLFDRGDNNPQDIVEGTAFIIERQAEFDVHNGEFLQITGWVSEHDTFGPNDQMGSINIKLPFNSIATGIIEIPLFQDADQKVRAKMSATVTAQG